MHGFHGGRVIRLGAGGGGDGLRRLLSAPFALGEGARQSWVTVTRVGRFTDPRYGEFEISERMLGEMVTNFEAQVFGQDVFVDVAHKPADGAAGQILRLSVEGGRLRALVEWTDFGLAAIRERGFRYLSAEYHENFQDNETRATHGPVLMGAGLVVRPAIKRLDPIQLSEADDVQVPVLAHPALLSELIKERDMKWAELIKKLMENLKAAGFGEAQVKVLAESATKALEPVTDEAQAKALCEMLEKSAVAMKGEIGDKPVQITLTAPAAAGLSADDVKKLMADEAQAQAKKLADAKTALDANVKLLSDTIGAAEGLDDELKKSLAADVADLVTAEMSAEQVKKLAAAQVASGQKISAAKKLAGMGFAWPQGNVHIAMGEDGTVKALQAQYDQRLGLAGLAESRRFANTGGKLLEENKAFAEKVLAQYDAANGAQLMAEHKLLAAGDGKITDVAIPAIFERTVIREALYSLIGLQFVDVDSLPFALTAQIPYSYRDTTAAQARQARVYEGGGIARAGVKQAIENAYPIPQKIAFEVSDEVRYLTANGTLQWEVVAENQRNASRIIGEDTEGLIFNEILNASDEYAVTAVASESLTQVNGTNKIFALTNFPVARPRKLYDLQGAQIGSTVNPITVTYGGSGKSEYDGSGTQASGTYWVMDYNLGEIRFVSEAGAAVTPPNATAITVGYSYTTNAYQFDTDLGSLAVDAKWDDFLYRYGLRKAVIEDQRYYQCNFGLMSGTVRTMIEQARQFSANYARSGTGLQADGNLGQIKSVPNFKTSAPGLAMADARVILGERGQTRFRMMKPWQMGELENQKDSNGRFVGKKEAYGDQFVVVHTPTQLKAAYTSIVLYSATARVNRAA